MASRRIARTKSLSGYLGSISQEVSEARLRSYSTSISAGAIDSGALAEEVQILDKAIQSINYNPGASGWRIDGAGNAEFGNVYVRGDINAYSGTIGYWNISNPLVERTFGTTTLHGTYLESFDHGATDVDATSGTYVGLFKSYVDIETNFTAVKLDSNKVTLTISGHTYGVGDPIVVTFDDVTYASLESSETSVATISDVTYDTVSYSVGSYNANGAADIALTETTGNIQVYYEDVAGLYLRDYGKVGFDYGYFSNKGVQFNSPYEVNLIENPSFEYVSLVGSTPTPATSEASWTFPASSLAASLGGNIAIGVGGLYSLQSSGSLGAVARVVWGATNISSESLVGTLDYNAFDNFRLEVSDRPLYFGFNMINATSPFSGFGGYPSYELSEIKFVFSNAASVDLYDVLTDECQAEWDAVGGLSWLYFAVVGNYTRQLDIPRVSPAKLALEYASSDPDGYALNSDISVHLPAVLYLQSQIADPTLFTKTTKVVTSDPELVGFYVDSFHLSTVERFFYGNNTLSAVHGWWPSDNTDFSYLVDSPTYASVETSTNWIDLDLTTSTFFLNQVDYLSFDSHSIRTLYVEPHVASFSAFGDIGYTPNTANTTPLTYTRISPGTYREEVGGVAAYYSVSSDYLLGNNETYFRTEALAGANITDRLYSTYIQGSAGVESTDLRLKASINETHDIGSVVGGKAEIYLNAAIDGDGTDITASSANFYVKVSDGTSLNETYNTAIKANNTAVTFSKPIVRSGGTSSQFLKADGSLDSNTYLTEGAQGPTGAQGTQGIQGTTGIQGAIGLQGANGTDGIIGVDGAQGVQGTQGIQGFGYAQLQGITGATGAQGATGLQGATGIQGALGTQGAAGAQGTDGAQGATGLQGATGIQGATGLQGTVGAQGTTGAQGIQGITGVQGLTGAQGITGADSANAVINGGFDIWQRGTSVTTLIEQFSADRWYARASGSAGASFVRESTTIPSGSRYAMVVSAISSATSSSIFQLIETSNTARYRNQTVVVSAKVAASASTPITLSLSYSTTVDAAFIDTFTTITPSSGGTATPTSTTYVTITGVFSVPSSANTLKVSIGPTSSTTNTWYVGQVQLELGSVATSFKLAGGNIQGELSACQRYYYRLSGGVDLVPVTSFAYYSTTQSYGVITFPVTMRVPPAGSVSSNTALSIYSAGSARTTSNVLPQAAVFSKDTMEIRATTTATTAGNAGWARFPVNSTDYLEFSAEL